MTKDGDRLLRNLVSKIIMLHDYFSFGFNSFRLIIFMESYYFLNKSEELRRIAFT